MHAESLISHSHQHDAKWYRIRIGMRLDSTEFMMIIKKTRCLLQNGICLHSTQSDRMTDGIPYCFGATARARERLVTIGGLDAMVVGAEGRSEGRGASIVALATSFTLLLRCQKIAC